MVWVDPLSHSETCETLNPYQSSHNNNKYSQVLLPTYVLQISRQKETGQCVALEFNSKIRARALRPYGAAIVSDRIYMHKMIQQGTLVEDDANWPPCTGEDF